MIQAGEKLNLHYRDLLQAVPAAWGDHQHATVVPATMDFTYDGIYNSFTPNTPNAFPSGLTQTLCDLELDTSIHKLFDGLPEIFDEMGHHPAHASHPPAVTVASSLFFPSTPPAQGSRPSSMSASAPQAFGVTSVAAHNAILPATFLRPKPVSGQELPPSDHRKGKGAPRKGTGRPRADAKVPGGGQTAGKKVLDAIVPSIAIPSPPLPSAHVACMVSKILPLPPVDLSAVKANEVHPMYPPLGLGPQAVLRLPKRSRKEASPSNVNTRTQKTRYFDKVEHIVRERWRRDDMAGKFLALESLLPPSSKRDRSTIVEDSMKLVKSLQHRKDEALKRRAELKLAAQSPGVKLNRIIQKIGSLAAIPMHGNHNLESPSTSSGVLSTKVGTKRPFDACTAPIPDSTQIPQPLRDCVKRFYVQSELSTGDIVIEMICEQIPNFHSVLLKSMETLSLDVLRCSITSTVNKLSCNIAVKPFPISASETVSSTTVMEGLSTVFQKV